MEVRSKEGSAERKFIINAGASEKIRHDALTSILDLLASRYKLAETVLFHRTKLAIIGLLDRILLEVRALYAEIGLAAIEFQQVAERLLLEGSDDSLPRILEELAKGPTEEIQKALSRALKEDIEALRNSLQPGERSLFDDEKGTNEKSLRGDLQERLSMISRLIKRLVARDVYTQFYKLRISEISGDDSPENPILKQLIAIYDDPANRELFLVGVEQVCKLPTGSLVMYCPPDATMNAKVAKVNLYIEGEVVAFDDYERRRTSLTCGALTSQIERFYELWSAEVYVHRPVWETLSEENRKHLRSVAGKVFFNKAGEDAKIVRQQIEPSIQRLRNRRVVAARSGEQADSSASAVNGKVSFPSGVPFVLKT